MAPASSRPPLREQVPVVLVAVADVLRVGAGCRRIPDDPRSAMPSAAGEILMHITDSGCQGRPSVKWAWGVLTRAA